MEEKEIENTEDNAEDGGGSNVKRMDTEDEERNENNDKEIGEGGSEEKGDWVTMEEIRENKEGKIPAEETEKSIKDKAKRSVAGAVAESQS